MRKLILGCGLLLAATAFGTPTPVPSPTPIPPVIPPPLTRVPVSAYLVFDDTTNTEAQLVNHRTRQKLVVPAGYTLYITDINWTCQSEASVDVKWSTSGTYIDSVRFPHTGQGKSVTYLTPLYSVKAGEHPVVYFDEPSLGVFYLGGYIE